MLLPKSAMWMARGLNNGMTVSACKHPPYRLSVTNVRTMTNVLNMETVNPNMTKLNYAVCGSVVMRSNKIKKELQSGKPKPFKRVINANIGDAQNLGQKPISYLRQVLACVTLPELIDNGSFPADVQNKAREILKACGGGSVGSYTTAVGIELIRRHVAEFLERRDGHPANWEDIALSRGASTAIRNCLQLFCNDINGKRSGVMVPIPQYPLYSASLTDFGLVKVDYFLDEDHCWALSIPELQRAIDNADCNVRAIVVINPGNPTGQVLTRQNIIDVIKFAHKNNLFIFADEVYQDNVYAEGSKFYSFKKILRELREPYSSEVELASFMSVSKGYMGECGMRGGLMELVNIDKEVQAQLYKCMSAMLCPPIFGQVAVDCLVDPPKKGAPSYSLWLQERTAVLDSLKQRSKMIAKTFSKMPGFRCNEIQGAMYAFPTLDPPPKAVEAAKAVGQEPDVFYAYRLLEETGICVVPGSGFGQRPGTYHIRTTILPQTEVLEEMLIDFEKFHVKFCNDFS